MVELSPTIARISKKNCLERNDINLAKLLVETDDDNLPVAENLPKNKTNQGKAKMEKEWGHNGIC